MADGALTLPLDDDMARRLSEAAQRAGMTPEAYALDRLSKALDSATAHQSDLDWTEADRRLADYDRTGIAYPLDDVLIEVRADLESRLAARR